MRKTRFFKIVILSLLTGCSGPHTMQASLKKSTGKNLHINNSENVINKIVFLTFGMTVADSAADTYRFTLLNTFITQGVLNKNPLSGEITTEPYKLYCEITDDSKKQVDMIIVQNPLLKLYEYSPDKITLGKKLVEAKTGEFYLRFQLTKNSKYLTIYKSQTGSQTLKKIYYAQI